ncbi:Synaptotagmin-9 [Homalodisca vitripennis]|nr:Synaptotagmin-9 [Homalodisca vitripennis]
MFEKKALGELMLTLCYLPKAGRLTVTIVKGQNLKAMDITGSSDPYVKVYLVCNGKRIRKKRTSVKRSTLSPVYNEALTFDVPASNIDNVSLIIKVIDYDRIGSDELMGCAAIGSSFIGAGRDHWLKMLECPRDNVAQWYPLLESIPGVLETPSPLRPVSLSCLNGSGSVSPMKVAQILLDLPGGQTRLRSCVTILRNEGSGASNCSAASQSVSAVNVAQVLQ